MALRFVQLLCILLILDVCVHIHARRNKNRGQRRKRPPPTPPGSSPARWVFKNQAMPCKDIASNCRLLRNLHWCTTYYRYMMINCKQSCGYCKSRPRPSTCGDRHRNCYRWAQRGECRKNPHYMTPNCARSCGFCTRVTAVNGNWGQWGAFERCPVTCGGGYQVRYRQCNRPAPKYGGKGCRGSHKQTRYCNTQSCNKGINGNWGPWGSLSSCSKTCGQGIRTRIRACNKPAPQHGGKHCVGSYQESVSCKLRDCVKAIDGKWGRWGPFSSCSKTCGIGIRRRTRACDNPVPQNSGKKCIGSYEERESCSLKRCAKAVDGKWGPWGSMSSCSKTCGEGIRTRIRACNKPAPQNGGKNCDGDSQESIQCKLKDCVKAIDGQWGSWSHTGCSVTCGKGVRTRLRKCDNPAPKNGGKDCIGVSVQTTQCTRPSCSTKVDGKWSSWGRWSSCSRSCNGGFSTRYRDCNNPPPSIDGLHCIGDDFEKIACNTQRCKPKKTLPPFSCGKSSVSRIVGGSLARTRDWPWQAGLKRGNDETIFCGGSLINREWVLTAAHCIYRLEPSRTGCVTPDPRIRVVFGEFDVGNVEGHEVQREVAQLCMHPQYSHKTLDYDIALLRLRDPVMSFTDHVKPVCMPTSSYVIPIGSNCTVTGFGRVGENADLSSKLRQASVPVKQLSYCVKQYPTKTVTNRMICAGYEGGQIDSCKGDSGGPFVCKDKYRFVLAGAVSWGVGCARAGQPGMYTNIKYFLPWIQKTMKDN